MHPLISLAYIMNKSIISSNLHTKLKILKENRNTFIISIKKTVILVFLL